jgi:hypothetical protein
MRPEVPMFGAKKFINESGIRPEPGRFRHAAAPKPRQFPQIV